MKKAMGVDSRGVSLCMYVAVFLGLGVGAMGEKEDRSLGICNVKFGQ